MILVLFDVSLLKNNYIYIYANIFNVDKICFKYMACKMKENGNDIFVTPQKKKVKRFINNLKLKYAKF